MVKFLFFSLLSCDGLELFVYFFSAGLLLSEIYLKNDGHFFFSSRIFSLELSSLLVTFQSHFLMRKIARR